jgi:phage baseplate assembly protein V
VVKFLRNPASTGGVGDPEATDHDRRTQDVIKFGRIKEVDYKRKPPSYRVEIGDAKDEDNYILTDWLPATGARAKGDRETHFLEVGEKVALLAEGGELSTAYVMPAGQYTEEDDEKETTDKAGVWHKTFKGGGKISYDRETGDWNIEGLDDKGTMTLKSNGCSIVFKDGTITLKAKNVVVDAGEKFESKAADSQHTATSSFKTIGKTMLGVDSAGEDAIEKVSLVGDIPTKQVFSKK